MSRSLTAQGAASMSSENKGGVQEGPLVKMLRASEGAGLENVLFNKFIIYNLICDIIGDNLNSEDVSAQRVSAPFAR